MNSQPIINSYSFSITGLQINYTDKGQTTIRSFCPHATCDLFQDLGLIEGFDTDRNGEPVILFTDHVCGVCRTGYALWFRFVEGFKVSQRMAEIIIERLEMDKEFRKSHAIINRLLRPLQAS